MSEPSPSNPSNPSDTELTTSPAAPSGRRREGNDSLWKRARRTLGTNSLTFLQPQSRPARSTSKDGSGPAAPNKRREQVRHAQRTHRQRTQNYIKTLESEVIRLRGQESTLTEERDKLQGQVEVLRTACMLNSIPLPLGLEDFPPLSTQQAAAGVNEMPATISYQVDESSNPSLHIDWPTFQPSQDPFRRPSQQPENFHVDKQEPTLPDDFTLPSLDYSTSLAPPAQPTHNTSRQSPNQSLRRVPPSTISSYAASNSPTPQGLRRPGHTVSKVTSKPSPLDDPAVAIDFVLALEQPCLPHIPHPNTTIASSRSHIQDTESPPLDTDLGNLPDAEIDIEPNNHIQMLSAPLVQFAPSAPKVDSSWQASATVIKELLNLSKSINLEGELTPVECWWRLKGHPGFQSMGRGEMEALKGELKGRVRCCGFGAVLDEQVFLQAVANVLASHVRAREQHQYVQEQRHQQYHHPQPALFQQSQTQTSYSATYA